MIVTLSTISDKIITEMRGAEIYKCNDCNFMRFFNFFELI